MRGLDRSREPLVQKKINLSYTLTRLILSFTPYAHALPRYVAGITRNPAGSPRFIELCSVGV